MKRSETTSKLLIDEPPLQVLPSLAIKIGLNEAIILQQIHYWLRTFQSSGKKDHLRDGKWWVYNSYDDWQNNFPFWGTGVIRRAIRNLEKIELLISKEFYASKGDRTKWYSIDYKILAKLSRESRTAKAPDPFVVDDRPSVADDKPSDQNEQMLNKKQKLTTENKRKELKDATLLQFLKLWKELFPNKPQPRKDNKKLNSKMVTRIQEPSFLEFWEEALERVSESPTCQKESWFHAEYFLRNSDNYMKCHERWMSWKDEELYKPAQGGDKRNFTKERLQQQGQTT